MKNISKFLLLALIVNYSHGRYLAKWSISTDQSLIDECLNKALRHISIDQGKDVSQSKVENLVGKTQFINGLNINLFFHLEQQRWKCSFYKSTIETLGIQYEKCNQVDNQDSPEQIQQKLSAPDNAEEKDDEAEIDELRQGARDDGNNQQGAERNVDDEEALNKVPDSDNTNARENDDEKALNNDPDNDNTNARENNQQKGSKQNMDNEDNQKVPEVNENNKRENEH